MNNTFTLTVDEIKTAIIECADMDRIQLQQRAQDVPSFKLNVSVTKCISIANGIQFDFGEGFVNLEFPEDPERGFFTEQQSYDITLEHSEDSPKGYLMKIGVISLFFHGNHIEKILSNLGKPITSSI